MEISVLASGSNGNCCLVEDKGSAILVDCGIAVREIEERARRLSHELKSIDGIIISHSHIDHIRSAGALSRKYKIPVYVKHETFREAWHLLGECETKNYTNHKFKVGKIEVVPIETSHDVASSGFLIGQFGIFTDTGKITNQIRDAMPKLKGVLIESNHDIDMLLKGPYPSYLKGRILSDSGHLCNIHASELVQARGKKLSLSLLGHLSAVNNTPELCKKTFETLVKRKMEYAVCSRDCEIGSWHL